LRTPGYLFQTFNCPKEAHEGFGEDKAYHEGAELENPGLGYSLELNCIRMISPGNAGRDPVEPETMNRSRNMNLLSFLFVLLGRQGTSSFISLTAPFICIVFLIFGSDRASGQQEWTWGLLATRIAQEKAKVVSYRVLIHRKQLEGKGYTDIKWLREFSEIGNHNISAIFDYGTDNSS